MQGEHVLHPDGLGRLRPARRAACHQHRHASPRHDQREHRHLPPAAQDARLQLRLEPRALDDRRRLLSLDAVDLSELYDTWYDPQQHGPARMDRAHGKGRPITELPIPDDVRQAGDEAVRRYQDAHATRVSESKPRSTGVLRWGRCSPTRKSRRRQERTRRTSGRASSAATVDAAHHCVCRPAAPRTRRSSTGPSRSRSCSATGSAEALGPRWISIVGTLQANVRGIRRRKL